MSITSEQLANLRLAVVLAKPMPLLDPEAIAALARCSHEPSVQWAIDLARAELESLRDPAWRQLATGQGGHG